MIAPIVQSMEIVTLVGAADIPDAVLDESLALCDQVVAADGGAARVLAYGIVPDAVIGDFDSFDPALRARIPADRLHEVADQNCTDFDKALARIKARLVLAVGFTGNRLDHELAVYNALVRHQGGPAIVIGAVDIAFHARSDLKVSVPVGTRLSLFPFADVQMDSSGLKWPTTGLMFSPSGRVGTSNETVQSEIHLRPSGPGMLVILPRSELKPAIAALAG